MEFSQYKSIILIIEYLEKKHIREIKKGKFSINWRDITRKYRLNPELTNEICLMFLIYHYLFRQIFTHNLKFSKTIEILSKIKDLFNLKYYSNILKFLNCILINSRNNIQSNGLEITKEKLMANTSISGHESDWILTVFSSFYKFYKLFFKILEGKNLENKNVVKKTDCISIKKQSVEFLSDYMNLFKNKPVGIKRFKSEFYHLYEISKKIPELFTITNSTIKISQNGLKLSQKVNKYNKIGRNPPKEVIFGDMKIQITD